MTHDLLYKFPENEVYSDPELYQNLHLDKTFGIFAFNKSQLEIFLNTLCKPVLKKENINYRREIVEDFLAFPEMLSSFEKWFGVIEKQKTDKLLQFGLSGKYSATSATDSAFHSHVTLVRDKAQSLEVVIRALKKAEFYSERKNLQSEGLKTLVDRIRQIIASEAFLDLQDACGSLSTLSPEYRYELCASIGESARVTEVGLVRADYPPERVLKKPRFLRLNPNESEVRGNTTSLRNVYVSSSLKEIADIISKIEANIYNEFKLISKQLAFYRTAVNYLNFIKEKGIPLVYPSINNDGEINIEELYDLNLCTQLEEVIPNDVKMQNGMKGLLLRGENNSGKTVYIRSVGTSQLLFQAGLPITASSATLTPVTGVYTQYAASEREFEEGNSAGRFEQEVMVLARFLDNVTPGSLIILNETFQTTAYEEGAEGLYNILQALERIGIRWMLVTHLHSLFDKFTQEDVAMLEVKSDGSHKVQKYIK